MPGEEHAFTLSTCRHMSRHFRRMASGGHFSEWRNLSVPRIYLLRNLKNDQSDGSAASLVKGFVFRSDFVSRIYGIPKFIAIIRQLRARIPQTAIGGKPQRSRNRQINANASDLRAFGAFGFRVGLYVPGAFAANTRIPAQAAGIESRGMLTPAACRPHGVHFLPEGERGARHLQEPGSRPDALPPSAQRTPSAGNARHALRFSRIRGFLFPCRVVHLRGVHRECVRLCASGGH